MNKPFSDETVIDYEKNLLGCYLLGADIENGITKDVFSYLAHRTIFPVLREIKEQVKTTDYTILINKLKERNMLESAGGAAYVSALCDTAYISNVAFYKDEVLKAFKGRSTWEAAADAKESLEKKENSDDVMVALASRLDKINSVMTATADNESGLSFQELLKKQFPAEDWLVDGLITSGLTVLTGASKIGKSWTALQLVTALDSGGYFLGSLKCSKCDVLYCALEDTPKRIQQRTKKQGFSNYNGSRLETKRRTVAGLRSYLKANPQFRVVIIDTLQKMMGINDLNDYAQTVTGISELKEMADSLGIAVVVIHHNRKGGDADADHMDSALGSTGIVATADAAITMRRKRGETNATLAATGRDFADVSYTLVWDQDICSWAITGKGELPPTLPEAQQQIVDLLGSKDHDWTLKEIAEEIGKNPTATSNLLNRLEKAGHIERPKYGHYRLKGSFTDSCSLREGESVKLTEGACEPIQPSPTEPEIY